VAIADRLSEKTKPEEEKPPSKRRRAQ
jgi:hypothetical protein